MDLYTEHFVWDNLSYFPLVHYYNDEMVMMIFGDVNNYDHVYGDNVADSVMIMILLIIIMLLLITMLMIIVIIIMLDKVREPIVKSSSLKV